jgi:hypothetical protein
MQDQEQVNARINMAMLVGDGRRNRAEFKCTSPMHKDALEDLFRIRRGEVLQQLMHDIEHNRQGLRKVVLETIRLACVEVMHLSSALAKNHTLTALYLQNNRLNSSSMMLLVPAVHRNHSLVVLDVSRNRLGDHGVTAIADVLRENCELRVLNIEDNMCGVEGGSAMVSALQTNSNLYSLSMGINFLFGSVDGNLFRNNSTLCFVDLSDCHIPNHDGIAMAIWNSPRAEPLTVLGLNLDWLKTHLDYAVPLQTRDELKQLEKNPNQPILDVVWQRWKDNFLAFTNGYRVDSASRRQRGVATDGLISRLGADNIARIRCMYRPGVIRRAEQELLTVKHRNEAALDATFS